MFEMAVFTANIVSLTNIDDFYFLCYIHTKVVRIY
jgi:hypothetical protein